MRERQIRSIEIVRAPAEEHRVERDDERREACFLDAGEEGEGYFVGAGPVVVGGWVGGWVVVVVVVVMLGRGFGGVEWFETKIRPENGWIVRGGEVSIERVYVSFIRQPSVFKKIRDTNFGDGRYDWRPVCQRCEVMHFRKRRKEIRVSAQLH